MDSTPCSAGQCQALSWFRVPARSLFLTSLGVAMLTGFGLETLRQRLIEVARWRRFAWRLAKIAGVVVGLLVVCRQLGLLGLVGSIAATPAELRSLQTSVEWTEPTAFVPPRYAREVWRACRGADRILHDPAFWITAVALGTAVTAGCLPWWRSGRRLAVELIGLLALCELAWQGFALIQVAPADLFFGPDPVSESLLLTSPCCCLGNTPRIRARDTFFLDLQAVRYGIEKTNVNDFFQLQHAAALYETLYPVATRAQESVDRPMSQAVEEYRRQVRQGVFDRMGVSSLVSDRVESDPPWPVLCARSCGR